MTKIEWTHREGTKGESWNPVTGCTTVSEGCRNCYAETLSHRLNAMGKPKYRGVTKNSGKWSGKVLFHEDRLEEPYRWKKPRTVFVCSMSDLFHEDVPREWLYKIFGMMGSEEVGHHTFIVLTKRAKRMEEFCNSFTRHGAPFGDLFPRVWLGVSVEDQAHADERIPHLLKVPAVVRFLSVEPLLAPVDLNGLLFAPPKGVEPYEWQGINWVIAGGESGPGARPCHLDWLRPIRDQCAGAGVPFFLKQLGSNPYSCKGQCPGGCIPFNNPRGKRFQNWSDGHGRKKRAGELALIDGRVWAEFPEEKLNMATELSYPSFQP